MLPFGHLELEFKPVTQYDDNEKSISANPGLVIAMRESENLTMTYIYLAIGSGILGLLLTFVLFSIIQYFDIELYKNLWLLGIPAVLAILMNIGFIELYRKYRKK